MKKFIAEFLGTFILVFIGCGAMVAINALVAGMGLTIPLGFSALTVALAFGLALALGYESFGTISGGHMNPALTIAAYIDGRMESIKQTCGYIIAQFAGGIAAGCILYLVTAQKASLGQNGYSYNSALQVNETTAIIIELLLTFFFVSFYLFRTKTAQHGSLDGIVIGLAFAACYIVALPFTGASLNPARSLGPAIFVGDQALRQVWIFILVPVVAGILAALVYKYLTKAEVTKEKPKDKAIADDDSKDESHNIVEPEIETHMDYYNIELIKAIEEARKEK
ncbi:MAG: aquaporin [Bacilli bacterium]